MTIEDHSAYMRDRYFFNQTMGGFTFDAFDKKKNKSALFDGIVNKQDFSKYTPNYKIYQRH